MTPSASLEQSNRFTHFCDLIAHNVSCERDDRILFENLSLTVQKGDLIQLVGPNGAGKTTLLRLMAGLNQDFQGEVHWHGENIQRCYQDYARQRLYIGHLSAIKKVLTPLENLRWFVSSWPEVKEADLWQALADVTLAGYEDVPCQQLSAGQQRRVALARLLVTPTPLWILDEPFTALDKEGVAWLEDQLARHVAAGGTVLITSHHALSDIPALRYIELGMHK
ncbi:MAG: cytochrome c biogenesis heme-transporting ATPase CcmA [Cycloclasticus sp.]|jgi:heme exporter protein A|nr:cytochrome c biogenesis heme-transporting ATPase CcmA [Cycloclasticus sp.]MBQ0789177.1 cytochrome c biogenesis heme-transporting ATPase CcmA [Cycloclasticus sp.]